MEQNLKDNQINGGKSTHGFGLLEAPIGPPQCLYSIDVALEGWTSSNWSGEFSGYDSKKTVIAVHQKFHRKKSSKNDDGKWHDTDSSEMEKWTGGISENIRMVLLNP